MGLQASHWYGSPVKGSMPEVWTGLVRCKSAHGGTVCQWGIKAADSLVVTARWAHRCKARRTYGTRKTEYEMQ